MQRHGEPLHHLRNAAGLRLRGAVQHLRLAQVAGAALLAKLAGGAQRRADDDAGAPDLRAPVQVQREQHPRGGQLREDNQRRRRQMTNEF